jgi:hypothetical protein
MSSRRAAHARPSGAESDVRTVLIPPHQSAVHHTVLSPGTALDRETAAAMASRFGHDFQTVRVHADESAGTAAAAIGANAFTVGDHIVFGRGQWSPRSEPGRQLLVHELTHVLQQRAGPSGAQGTLDVGPTDSLAEQEAARNARDIPGHLVGRSTSISGVHPQIQRDPITAVEAIGLAMGGTSILQSQINEAPGGLSYESDQISYPSEQKQVPPGAREVSVRAAEFFSPGRFVDNHTVFNLHGVFAKGTMANVYIDLAETTTYAKSELSFKAVAMQTAYGTPEDPQLRFVCTGRFDPAGPGDASYRAGLEVDQTGSVNCIDFTFTNGEGEQTQRPGRGFHLRLNAGYGPPGEDSVSLGSQLSFPPF